MGLINDEAGAWQWPIGSLEPWPRELFRFMCIRATDPMGYTDPQWRPEYVSGSRHAIEYLWGREPAWTDLEQLRGEEAAARLKAHETKLMKRYKRSVRHLVEAGAIERTGTPHRGRAARYRLEVNVHAYRTAFARPEWGTDTRPSLYPILRVS